MKSNEAPKFIIIRSGCSAVQPAGVGPRPRSPWGATSLHRDGSPPQSCDIAGRHPLWQDHGRSCAQCSAGKDWRQGIVHQGKPLNQPIYSPTFSLPSLHAATCAFPRESLQRPFKVPAIVSPLFFSAAGHFVCKHTMLWRPSGPTAAGKIAPFLPLPCSVATPFVKLRSCVVPPNRGTDQRHV